MEFQTASRGNVESGIPRHRFVRDGERRICDSEAYEYAGTGEAVPCEISCGVPVIDASVSIDDAGDLPVKMLVDTGAAQLLLFAFSREDIRKPRRTIDGSKKILSKGFTGTICGSTGRLTCLRIGKYALDGVITSFPDEESWGRARVLGQNGMIGNDVLRRFFVVFDYPHQCIYLEPGRCFKDPFDWDMAGVVAETTSKGALEALDIIVGSPAEENDILPGDAIVAVDGRPLADMGDEEIWSTFTRDTARLNLTIERGGKKRLKKPCCGGE